MQEQSLAPPYLVLRCHPYISALRLLGPQLGGAVLALLGAGAGERAAAAGRVPGVLLRQVDGGHGDGRGRAPLGALRSRGSGALVAGRRRGAGESRDLSHVTPSPTAGDWRAERGSQGAGTLLQPGTEGRAQGWGVWGRTALLLLARHTENSAPLALLPFALPSSSQGVQSTQLAHSRSMQQHTPPATPTGETEAQRGCNMSEATWPGRSRSADLRSSREALAPHRPSPAGELAGP